MTHAIRVDDIDIIIMIVDIIVARSGPIPRTAKVAHFQPRQPHEAAKDYRQCQREITQQDNGHIM